MFFRAFRRRFILYFDKTIYKYRFDPLSTSGEDLCRGFKKSSNQDIIPTLRLDFFLRFTLIELTLQILVLLGENGTGKTTFIRMMAGKLPPDDGTEEIPRLNISYKPQTISPRYQGLVRQLLHEKIRDAYVHPQVGHV